MRDRTSASTLFDTNTHKLSACGASLLPDDALCSRGSSRPRHRTRLRTGAPTVQRRNLKGNLAPNIHRSIEGWLGHCPAKLADNKARNADRLENEAALVRALPQSRGLAVRLFALLLTYSVGHGPGSARSVPSLFVGRDALSLFGSARSFTISNFRIRGYGAGEIALSPIRSSVLSSVRNASA